MILDVCATFDGQRRAVIGKQSLRRGTAGGLTKQGYNGRRHVFVQMDVQLRAIHTKASMGSDFQSYPT